MRYLEHEIQCSFFQWVDMQAQQDSRYQNIFAVPNGEQRGILAAVRLKREGVRRGVLDVVVAVPSGQWHGMFIEFKKKGGKLSEFQKAWATRLTRNGYAVIIAFDFVTACNAVKMYFGSPDNLLNEKGK